MKVPEFELLVCLFAFLDNKGRTTLYDNLIDYLGWDEQFELDTTILDIVNRYKHLSCITILKKWQVE